MSERQSYHKRWQAELHTSLVEGALFTKERVRANMRRAMKESHEEVSQAVSMQRKYQKDIERRRRELSAMHASNGKQLHLKHYGASAAIVRASAQENKANERKELSRKSAALEGERLIEQAADAAARSAAVERVQQQCGFHVTQGVREEEANTRRAAARLKREHAMKLQAQIYHMKEEQRGQAEESRLRVLELEEQARRRRRADVERKQLRARLVREADQVVNSAASQVRQESARRRKDMHDAVRSGKYIDAPIPKLAVGVGGLACSRKASLAAAFLPNNTGHKTSIPNHSNLDMHASIAGSYVFDRGPTGLSLLETPAGVVIDSVDPGSLASALRIPLGFLILAVNGLPVFGLSRIGVNKAISKSNWPMSLLVSPCPEYTFGSASDRKGGSPVAPAGFTLKDTQNGVVVDRVVPDSPAARQDMPIGGLLVTVNGEPATGLSKTALGPTLKQRPLAVQIVPREVAYLFRPRRPYRSSLQQEVVAQKQPMPAQNHKPD